MQPNLIDLQRRVEYSWCTFSAQYMPVHATTLRLVYSAVVPSARFFVDTYVHARSYLVIDSRQYP